MSNVLKLLMVTRFGTGGAFTTWNPLTITSINDGGWTQITGPHAVHYGGYNYVGYVDESGNLEVVYISDKGVPSAPITLSAAFQDDAHAAPSLWVRETDHKLVTAFCGHDSSAHYYIRISTNSLDSDPTLSGGWGDHIDIFASIGATKVTYATLGQTTEANNPIYVMYRDKTSTFTGTIAIATSTDGGATFGTETIIVSDTNVLIYAFAHFGTSRIDYAVSNGNGVADSNVDIFHFYYSGGNYYKTDGTALGSPPFTTSALTKVYDTGTGTGWPTGMGIDATGNPVILSEVLNTALGTTMEIHYHRWNGSSWVDTIITTLDLTGLPITTHCCLDESDPGRVWISAPISGVNEIFYYHTDDNGATFHNVQMTRGSSNTGNIYPVNIHNRGDDLQAMWLYGTYVGVTEGNYTLGIKAARRP